MKASPKIHTVILATGSNAGDRRKNMLAAEALIAARIGKLMARSSLYETAAWGVTDQADFLNQVFTVYTVLSPQEILRTILEIETYLGRERKEKWGSRVIDIDLLFYDRLVVNDPNLQIPHPQLQNRHFVLIPLLEIMPDWEHPVLHQTIEDLYVQCQDDLPVRLLE